MGHSVKCSTEVEHSYICLDPRVKGGKEVAHCYYQLGFTRVTLSEAMLEMSQWVIGLHEGQYMGAHDVLKQLT